MIARRTCARWREWLGTFQWIWHWIYKALDFPLNLASKTGSEMAMEMVENAIGNRIIAIEIG